MNKKNKMHVLEELRKRVIDKDIFLKEKQEKEKLLKANKEALLEMTDLSKEEVDLIEKEIEKEIIVNAKKKQKRLILIISAVVLIFVIFTLLRLIDNSSEKLEIKNLLIHIDKETHHLGDNKGNEGTVFIKKFDVSNLTYYDLAIFTITFTKWGPNTKKPPLVLINSNKIGSVIENLPKPGTDDCWDGPAIDNSYDYNCDFTYETNVYKLLNNGINTFEIRSRKKTDDYIFKNIQIKLIKK